MIMFDIDRLNDLKRRAAENKPVRFEDKEQEREFTGFDLSRR